MRSSKTLILLLLFSLAAVVFLPIFAFTYFYPSVDDLLIQDAEHQARMVAKHFSLYFRIPEHTLGPEDISIDLKDEISMIVENFSLEKVKVFSGTGEILYSTHAEDIGRVNTKDYFRSVVMRGRNFSKIVRKDTRTLEGRVVSRDVIETYVPIFGRDRVVGAFEIYYDITAQRLLFNGLLHRSALIIYGVSFFLMSALGISLFKLYTNMRAREQAERELSRHRDELEQLVDKRTAELTTANAKLQEDIAQRKRAEQALLVSEEKYRSLIEMAGDAIFIGDAETGIIHDVNRKGVELIGRPAREIIGLHFLALHPEDEKEEYRTLVDNRYRTIPVNKALHVQHISGRKVPVEITSSILDIGGRKIVQGIFRDISQRLRVEVELQKSERLKTASVLAGGIAHDFNNLLTAIIGNISLALVEAGQDEGIRKRLNETKKAVNRARALTHQLLTFAKGGSPVKQVTPLNTIIEESASFVLHGSKVRCECRLPDDLWYVNIDEGQISQVINNLVINASHAMDRGGLCRVWAENVQVAESGNLLLTPGPYVRIAIRDEGHGIPEDRLDRIFDPFYTTKPQGSGLGLSSVFTIVKNHGGQVTVESRVGQGSTFYIYLPAVVDGADRTRDTERQDETPVQGTGRILVMDDEEIVRDAVGSLLQYLGYEVDTAVEGGVALNMYEEAMSRGRPYDAVILDLTVPGGMGGKETVRRLKELDPGARVIVSSGYYTDPIMANYRSYGFDGVVPKPYQVEELGRVINEVIHNP